ncbi:MAG TPA: amidohydrolase family protein [archaeon]|nr:amidohydrolase family protein [archaeon]
MERELLILAAVFLAAAFSSCSGERGRGTGNAGPSGAGYLAAERHKSPESDVFLRIKREVDAIRLVDTHEHLITEKFWLTQEPDFFWWFQQPWFPQYSGADLVSAGLPEDDLQFIIDKKNPLVERWERVAPYWPVIKFTGFGQALRIAARDIYGIPDIDENTWQELSKRIAESKKAGFYNKVLHDMAGIDLVILDQIVLADPFLSGGPPERTVMVKRFDYTFIELNREVVDSISKEYGMSIKNLDDLLAALDKAFQELVSKGYYVGLKCAQAYDRVIYYENVPKAQAEKLFAEIFKRDLTREERKPLEDFMLHQVAERAGRYDLPFQIHTGIQAGPGNVVTNSKPTHLLNLFQQYPRTKFVLFHGSFPYMGELTVLAKNYPNVYLDMCWLPIISPTVTKEWLHKWLETVPVNKIMAFGGDYQFPEGTYAHSVIARQVVAETLAEKVEAGYLTEEEAVWIARRLLRENAIELFRLERFL